MSSTTVTKMKAIVARRGPPSVAGRGFGSPFSLIVGKFASLVSAHLACRTAATRRVTRSHRDRRRGILRPAPVRQTGELDKSEGKIANAPPGALFPDEEREIAHAYHPLEEIPTHET